jgi:inner membrane protein
LRLVIRWRVPGDRLIAVENLSHSLLGAAMAELALPPSATRAQRRIFFTAGVIAANLPDADLLYSNITPPPLGYLLHHRGHTHTLVGVLGQALLIGAVCLVPALQRRLGDTRKRLWVLIAASLLGHLILDSWNSYGVHPFSPFDMRWYYGDAIFIVEPWFWVFLGVAATANAQGDRSRLLLGALFAVVAAAFAWVGMIPTVSVVALVVIAAMLAWIVKRWSPRRRSGAAIAAVVLFVAMMFGLRQVVRERVIASLQPTLRGDLVDVVLSPQAADPFCWTAIAIERNDRDGEYVMSRGSVSLVPLPLSGLRCGQRGQTSVEWNTTLHESLATLRALDHDNCWASAWLQFGRAPALSDDAIGDFRFGGISRGNFSTMPLRPADAAPACPPHLTHWGKPRADLLTRS